MADVYYKIDGNNIYYTNEQKTGYTLRNSGATVTNNKHVIVELYNDKFILPENSSNLFFTATNTSFDNINKWDTSEVTAMDGVFVNCNSLQSLDVSNFNTSNVTTMVHMFQGCKSLQSLDLSSFNTSNVTDMTSMFYNCNALQSLDLSSFDTSKVTRMYTMFSGCIVLTSLDVSSFDTSKVTDMSGIFQSCRDLVTIYASTYFVVDQVQSSGSMFLECTNLVGGAGTTYASANPKDKTYAHIDGGTADPGYFTFGARPPRWIECTPYIKENGIWVPVEVYY